MHRWRRATVCWVVTVSPWDGSSPLDRISWITTVWIEIRDPLQLRGRVIAQGWDSGMKSSKPTRASWFTIFEMTFLKGKYHQNTDYLLSVISALSASSSTVVFTDRLLGDRSLFATWPVILGSECMSKQREKSPRRSPFNPCCCWESLACSSCSGRSVFMVHMLVHSQGTGGGLGRSFTVPNHQTSGGCWLLWRQRQLTEHSQSNSQNCSAPEN